MVKMVIRLLGWSPAKNPPMSQRCAGDHGQRGKQRSDGAPWLEGQPCRHVMGGMRPSSWRMGARVGEAYPRPGPYRLDQQDGGILPAMEPWVEGAPGEIRLRRGSAWLSHIAMVTLLRRFCILLPCKQAYKCYTLNNASTAHRSTVTIFIYCYQMLTRS